MVCSTVSSTVLGYGTGLLSSLSLLEALGGGYEYQASYRATAFISAVVGAVGGSMLGRYLGRKAQNGNRVVRSLVVLETLLAIPVALASGIATYWFIILPEYPYH
jgi:hypothetical protein